MPVPNQVDIRNRLLSLLPADDFDRLRPDLEPVDLPRGFVVVEPDRPIEHAVFLDYGICSLVAISPEGQEVEAGICGREGFSPTVLAMGADQMPYRSFMQVAGSGHRIGTSKFVDAIGRSPAMRALFLRYAHTFTTQTTFTALSNAIHNVDERLARWLLMCDDRVDGHTIGLTHEFVAVMLAVRRPSVTTALHVLEGNGFIRSERGRVVIRNRQALEEFASDAYGKPEAEYRRLIGPMR